jgi:hypothetical protein
MKLHLRVEGTAHDRVPQDNACVVRITMLDCPNVKDKPPLCPACIITTNLDITTIITTIDRITARIFSFLDRRIDLDELDDPRYLYGFAIGALLKYQSRISNDDSISGFLSSNCLGFSSAIIYKPY